MVVSKLLEKKLTHDNMVIEIEEREKKLTRDNMVIEIEERDNFHNLFIAIL